MNDTEKELINKIRKKKDYLGNKLVILTHHYQRSEIVDLGDFRGDSYGLSKKAASQPDAHYIVFCGVYFMAESAEILAQPHQTVQIPHTEAGCWMADMADIVIVERAWHELTDLLGPESIIPVVYMNSDAELKAFCGRNGGLVCTSSNASKAFEWSFEKSEKILFFPDQHLGRNSGNRIRLQPEEIILWNPHKPMGGNKPADIRKARLILWDGYCLVHTRFTKEHVIEMRKKFPGARIVVHPECTEEVVALADAVGSTSYIVNYVQTATPGSTIIIGTEINLVERLKSEHPDKKILELSRSLCPNMYKINLENLLWTLDNPGKVNVVEVPDQIKTDARKALDRMLALPS